MPNCSPNTSIFVAFAIFKLKGDGGEGQVSMARIKNDVSKNRQHLALFVRVLTNNNKCSIYSLVFSGCERVVAEGQRLTGVAIAASACHCQMLKAFTVVFPKITSGFKGGRGSKRKPHKKTNQNCCYSSEKKKHFNSVAVFGCSCTPALDTSTGLIRYPCGVKTKIYQTFIVCFVRRFWLPVLLAVVSCA